LDSDMRRIKQTYKAELDYTSQSASGEWVIGFLDENGNPYECPHTTDENLIRKLKKLEFKKLKVTVEINEKPDSWGREYPKLLDVTEAE